jgi:hypothetical protein
MMDQRERLRDDVADLLKNAGMNRVASNRTNLTMNTTGTDESHEFEELYRRQDVFGARPNILRNANANTAAKTGAKIKSNKAESVSSMSGVCDKHGAIVVSCIFCQTPY